MPRPFDLWYSAAVRSPKRTMKRTVITLVLVALLSATSAAQTEADKYRIFDANGNPASLEMIVAVAGGVDVLFLGEYHDDAVAHLLQLEIFRRIIASYADRRQVSLSFEMFERDVQIVVDEYLSGKITEAQFLASSRPWNNYKTDYRPLLELAKEKKLPVVAANPPRRYVNMVSRLGRGSLEGLSKEAKRFLPPLPYPQPSEAYAKKFRELMGGGPELKAGLVNILDSQTLWDTGMAHAITKQIKKKKNGLVVHVNGGFHSESRLGTAEQLLSYRKKTKFLVVTMRYEDDFVKFDPAKHKGLGDFVILTDKKVPRSFTR